MSSYIVIKVKPACCKPVILKSDLDMKGVLRNVPEANFCFIWYVSCNADAYSHLTDSRNAKAVLKTSKYFPVPLFPATLAVY